MEWARRHPIVVLLLPLVACILCCYYTGKPVDLLRDTDADYLDSLRTFRVVATNYPRTCKKTVRCEAEVLAVAEGGNPRAAQGRVYLYLVPDSTDEARNAAALQAMQPGDTLFVRMRIRRAGYLGDFDYGTYLRMQGIVGTAVVWRDQWRLLPVREETPWTLPPPHSMAA